MHEDVWFNGIIRIVLPSIRWKIVKVFIRHWRQRIGNIRKGIFECIAQYAADGIPSKCAEQPSESKDLHMVRKALKANMRFLSLNFLEVFCRVQGGLYQNIAKGAISTDNAYHPLMNSKRRCMTPYICFCSPSRVWEWMYGLTVWDESRGNAKGGGGGAKV